MNNPKTQWWRQPVRMMRRDYISDFKQLLKADLGVLAREAKSRWHVNVEWMMATPGCSPGMAHLTTFNTPKFDKFPGMGDFDLLRSYLPHARRNGIKLVPYLNMHWYSYEFSKQHAGWEQLLEDGTPYGVKNPLYGNGTTFCVNSGWREWAFDMIRAVMKTGVDGCFLDGPVMFAGGCYCASCRRLFAQSAGRAKMPSFGDWSDPRFKLFLQFRSASMVRFLRDARKAALEINPSGVIFLNGGRYSSHDILSARAPEALAEFQDFTGAEEFMHCTDQQTSPFASLHLARFLSAGPKPGVVFIHHAMSTWHYNPLCAPEMQTALAQAAAGGANPWFAIFMDSMKTRAAEAYAGVEKIQSFLEKNDRYIAGAQSAADIGVLVSRQSLNYYISNLKVLSKDVGSGREDNLVQDRGSGRIRADMAGRRAASEQIINGEYKGCFDALTYSHVPLRVIWERNLDAGSLKNIKVLIAPNPACLDDQKLAALRNYVARGGNLIVTFEAGFYDGWGRKAARRSWQKYLGIERVIGAFAPSRVEDYLTIASAQLPDLSRGLLMPRTFHALKIKPTADARVLARFNEPVGMSYQKLAGVSRYPAVVAVRRGRGNIIYVCAPLFDSYQRFRLDDHRKLAESLVRLAGGGKKLLVETDAPGSLAVEARAGRRNLMLHLVNATGDMKRPMGSIVPLRDVRFSVRAKCRQVRALNAGRALRFRQKGARVEFGVPRIDAYEIILLEK